MSNKSTGTSSNDCSFVLNRQRLAKLSKKDAARKKVLLRLLHARYNGYKIRTAMIRKIAVVSALLLIFSFALALAVKLQDASRSPRYMPVWPQHPINNTLPRIVHDPARVSLPDCASWLSHRFVRKRPLLFFPYLERHVHCV